MDKIQVDKSMPTLLLVKLKKKLKKSNSRVCHTPINPISVSVLFEVYPFLRFMNTIFFQGGFDIASNSIDAILEFSPETESWTSVAMMREPRGGHAISVVNFEDFVEHCDFSRSGNTQRGPPVPNPFWQQSEKKQKKRKNRRKNKQKKQENRLDHTL